MCTVSWLLNSSGYDVFFNRDEQKSRAIAFPPSHLILNGTPCLMPLDPEGGGSWIAANHHGISICLLNYYQGEIPSNKLTSRGRLLKFLSSFPCVNALIAQLNQLEMRRYAPFTLLVFNPNLNSHQEHVLTFQWDGNVLFQRASVEPMISSSVDYLDVMVTRRQAYKSMMNGKVDVENAILYHASHLPKADQRSVCMHRVDAHTVSFTHLKVTPRDIQMTYIDGSPCEQNTAITSVLKRKDQAFKMVLPGG